MSPRIFVLLAIGALLFTNACSGTDLSLQRKSTESSDTQWSSFEDVKMSFEDIEQKIKVGQMVTVSDLQNRGFGPGSKNVVTIIYTSLEDLFIGPRGDRSRLPEDIRQCTAKKGNCYGIVVQISSLNKAGEEGWFERLMTKKKTRVTGWQFSGVFAAEKRGSEDVVVAAYTSKEEANISKTEEGSDPRERVLNTINIGSFFGGIGF